MTYFKIKSYRYKIKRAEYELLGQRITTGEIGRAMSNLIKQGYIILAHSLVVNNINLPHEIPFIEGYFRAFKKPKNFPMKEICFDGISKKKRFFNPIFLKHHPNNFLDDELVSNLHCKDYIIDGERRTDIFTEIIKQEDFIPIQFNIKNET